MYLDLLVAPSPLVSRGNAKFRRHLTAHGPTIASASLSPTWTRVSVTVEPFPPFTSSVAPLTREAKPAPQRVQPRIFYPPALVKAREQLPRNTFTSFSLLTEPAALSHCGTM